MKQNNHQNSGNYVEGSRAFPAGNWKIRDVIFLCKNLQYGGVVDSMIDEIVYNRFVVILLKKYYPTPSYLFTKQVTEKRDALNGELNLKKKERNENPHKNVFFLNSPPKY